MATDNRIPTHREAAIANAVKQLAVIEVMVSRARGRELDNTVPFESQVTNVVRLITATEAVRAIGSLSPP